MFQGARTTSDDLVGEPGTGYHLALALFGAMKVPDQTSWGTVTRVSPGGRIHCTARNGTAEVSCYLTGVIGVSFP